MFPSQGNGFHTFATVNTYISGIRFQYFVNSIIHTSNIKNNKSLALSTSEPYDILFNVKVNVICLGDVKL